MQEYHSFAFLGDNCEKFARSLRFSSFLSAFLLFSGYFLATFLRLSRNFLAIISTGITVNNGTKTKKSYLLATFSLLMRKKNRNFLVAIIVRFFCIRLTNFWKTFTRVLKFIIFTRVRVRKSQKLFSLLRTLLLLVIFSLLYY